MSFILDLLICLLFLGSIFTVGMAAVAAFPAAGMLGPVRGPAIGIAAGVVLHGLLGALLVFAEAGQLAALASLVTANALAVSTLSRRRAGVALREGGGRLLALWGVAVVAGLAFSYVPATVPQVMIDGPYVFKRDTEFVRIQALAGDYPPDNIIPFVAAEYMVRGIDFRQERPLLPGQEISNRPVLMSLATVPFRLAVRDAQPWEGPVPKFEYLGTQWPDAGIFMQDERVFRIYLALGIVLNATLVVGAFVLAEALGLTGGALLLGLLMVSSPYFLLHTVFTWPKNLAGFFALLAVAAIVQPLGSRVATARLQAAGTALAYWAHPYGVFFAASLWLRTALRGRRDKDWRPLVHYTLVAIAIALPWVIYTRLWLGISSDLVFQNVLTGGSLFEVFWARLFNLYNLLFPSALGRMPFRLDLFTRDALINLPFLVGLLILPFTVVALVTEGRTWRSLLLFGCVVPGGIIWVLFSNVNPPALHGWQAIVPLLLVLGLLKARGVLRSRAFAALVGAQVVLNLVVLGARIYEVTVR